jgi:hypothetical protein
MLEREYCQSCPADKCSGVSPGLGFLAHPMPGLTSSEVGDIDGRPRHLQLGSMAQV